MIVYPGFVDEINHYYDNGLFQKNTYLENLVYHFFRQLWLVLVVKLMEINSNWVFQVYLSYFMVALDPTGKH